MKDSTIAVAVTVTGLQTYQNYRIASIHQTTITINSKSANTIKTTTQQRISI